MSYSNQLSDAPRFLAGLGIEGGNPADGKSLVWNDTTKQWEYFTPAVISGNLKLLNVTMFNDVVAGAAVAGSLMYADNTPKWNQLAKASNGFLLTLTAGLPAWLDLSAAGYLKGGAPPTIQSGIPLADILNAGGVVGDIFYWDGANLVRLAAGANGQILQLAGGLPSWVTKDTIKTWIGCHEESSYALSATAGVAYSPVWGRWTGVGPSEAVVQSTVPNSGTWRRLTIRVVGNAATNANTITSRINGADGNQTLAIGAGATGLFQDTTHTDVLANGDQINIKCTQATVGNITSNGNTSEVVF